MDRKFLKAQFQSLTKSGLPVRAEVGGAVLTATLTSRRAEEAAELYGASATYSASLLCARADLPNLPKAKDPVTVEGARYRVLRVAEHDLISVTIDLERWT